MNIRTLSHPFELVDEARELVTIKLVVPENINHWDPKFLVKNSPQSLILDMDIACQNNNVSSNVGHIETAKLDM